MRDVATTIDAYIAIWNETDAARRRALIAETWTEDATYVDPHASVGGAAEIGALVGAVQEQFPGHRFTLAGTPDAHHDVVRFTWHLVGQESGQTVAVGHDVGTLADDGRLRAVTGFLDPAPAG